MNIFLTKLIPEWFALLLIKQKQKQKQNRKKKPRIFWWIRFHKLIKELLAIAANVNKKQLFWTHSITNFNLNYIHSRMLVNCGSLLNLRKIGHQENVELICSQSHCMQVTRWAIFYKAAFEILELKNFYSYSEQNLV